MERSRERWPRARTQRRGAGLELPKRPSDNSSLRSCRPRRRCIDPGWRRPRGESSSSADVRRATRRDGSNRGLTRPVRDDWNWWPCRGRGWTPPSRARDPFLPRRQSGNGRSVLNQAKKPRTNRSRLTWSDPWRSCSPKVTRASRVEHVASRRPGPSDSASTAR